MKILFSIILSISLFFSLLFIPPFISAQYVRTNYLNDNISNASLSDRGIISVEGLNPVWLLLLLTIPFLFVLYHGITEITNTNNYKYRHALVGTKGGKAKRTVINKKGLTIKRSHTRTDKNN